MVLSFYIVFFFIKNEIWKFLNVYPPYWRQTKPKTFFFLWNFYIFVHNERIFGPKTHVLIKHFIHEYRKTIFLRSLKWKCLITYFFSDILDDIFFDKIFWKSKYYFFWGMIFFLLHFSNQWNPFFQTHALFLN